MLPSDDVSSEDIISDDVTSDSRLGLTLRGSGLHAKCEISTAEIDFEVTKVNLEVVKEVKLINHGDFEAKFTLSQVFNQILISDWSIFWRFLKIIQSLRSQFDQTLHLNRFGQSLLFDVSPQSGILAKKGELTVKIRFNPDHSGLFNDSLELRLFNQENFHIDTALSH